VTGHPKRQKAERSWSLLALVVVAVALPMVGACKTFSDRTRATRSALDASDLNAALRASNRALGVRSAEALPDSLGKNDALLLLDRAMVLQSVQKYALSSRDFQVADKALEVLDFSRSTSDEIVRYMFSDSAGPYKARPYEKLMLNTMNMLNYLVPQNLEGARVEARRFSVMRSYLLTAEGVDQAAVKRAGVPGSYFAGYVFEKTGAFDQALRYYDEVLQATDAPSLAAPIRRLTRLGNYRTPRLESVKEAQDGGRAPLSATESSEVLIVISYGRVPPLVAKRIPIGLALTIAAAFLPPSAVQQANRLAGQGLVTWINYPDVAPQPSQYPSPQVRIDGASYAPDIIADVEAVARDAWAASKGRVMAAAVTRMLTRAAIGAGTGVAVGKASGQSGIGVLASMITQASMVAADKPDTRSWATLPARIAVVRAQLSPGAHTIEISVVGREHRMNTTAESGQWMVIDVMQLATP
jgi:hypothetical protein